MELVLFTEYIFEDLKKSSRINKSIIELWDADVSYKRKDHGEGTEWEAYLIDEIEFRFNRNDHFNFI